MKNLKELANSTLLAEVKRRLNSQAIRFNYDSLFEPQHVSGLISWNALDPYELDFMEIEKSEKKELSLKNLVITSKAIKE